MKIGIRVIGLLFIWTIVSGCSKQSSDAVDSPLGGAQQGATGGRDGQVPGDGKAGGSGQRAVGGSSQQGGGSQLGGASSGGRSPAIGTGGVTGSGCDASSDCDDKDPCTVDSCSAAGVCNHAPLADGSVCGDGGACGPDKCEGGVCVPAICSTSGWVETFDATTRQPLVQYDPRWTKILGQLDVDPDLGAAVGTEATDDGGDDYAFRGVDTPTGSVEIEIDFYWGGNGAVGAEGAVQLTTPHRLYEATLWRGTLDLIYAYGPTPWDYESIAYTPVTAPPGNYRIVFRTVLNGERWELTARLLDGAKQYAVIGEVSIADSRLGPGGQGIGIWADGSPTSYVTEMRVTPLD